MKSCCQLLSVKNCIAAGLLLVLAQTGIPVSAKDAVSSPKVTVSDRPIDRAGRIGVSFAPVVKKVAVSVVTIFSTRTVKLDAAENPFMQDPRLRRFFGGGNPRMMPSQQGLGSGVIISDDGYILTNHHVVEGADSDGVKVALFGDETKYSAKIVGSDPQTDIAILKIDGKKLTPITFGDSEQLEVGDVVLAVGNPFGVGQSVSMGIISALGRGFGILGRDGYEDFIQTDAPINPGNSGGALVDVEGRLVGISQSIMSGSGANAGVGFAVPVNLARSIMERLVTDGKVTRGYLGVSIQPVTLELAKAFKMTDAVGVLIGDVQSGTPAAKAGVLEGDVITAVNGKKVADPRHLRLVVSQIRPQTKVPLTILRDGKEKTLMVTVGTLPDELASVGSNKPEAEVPGNDALDGVQVADLDAQARRLNNIPARVRGAVVTNLEPGSAAAEAGLRPGDVIVEVERQPVSDADELVRLASGSKDQRLLLRVWSSDAGGRGTRYIVLNPAKGK